MDKFLKKELPISAHKLLQEIAPLLEDYLEGTIEFVGTAIKYTMPNGQQFLIIARKLQ